MTDRLIVRNPDDPAGMPTRVFWHQFPIMHGSAARSPPQSGGEAALERK